MNINIPSGKPLTIETALDAIAWYKSLRMRPREPAPDQYIFVGAKEAVFVGMDLAASTDRSSQFIIIDDPMRVEASRLFCNASFDKRSLLRLVEPRPDFERMLNATLPRPIAPSDMEFFRSLPSP